MLVNAPIAIKTLIYTTVTLVAAGPFYACSFLKATRPPSSSFFENKYFRHNETGPPIKYGPLLYILIIRYCRKKSS